MPKPLWEEYLGSWVVSWYFSTMAYFSKPGDVAKRRATETFTSYLHRWKIGSGYPHITLRSIGYWLLFTLSMKDVREWDEGTGRGSSSSVRLSAAILGARRSSWTEFGVDAGEAAVVLGDAVFNEHTTKEGEKNGKERRVEVARSGVAGGGARSGLEGGKRQEGVPLVEWGAEEEVIDAPRTMRGRRRGAVKEPAPNTPYGALKKKDIKGFALVQKNRISSVSMGPTPADVSGAVKLVGAGYLSSDSWAK
ncbi:hypothetical protein B0H14DRAFT_2595377 [Mycena olivaceomarginata]|nr:hypothetical protein B0H14DRAFT_2595377 [Mycena olivaceomarginata]